MMSLLPSLERVVDDVVDTDSSEPVADTGTLAKVNNSIDTSGVAVDAVVVCR